ncbi:unnamed protein product, partial [marine sediment metagenome]
FHQLILTLLNGIYTRFSSLFFREPITPYTATLGGDPVRMPEH